MLSRVAHHLYWLSRYVERAENTARLITVNANLNMDLPRRLSPGWKPLVEIMGLEPVFEAKKRAYSERSVVAFLVGDRRNPSSIVTAIGMARENCRTVRDLVPREVWEHLNDLHLQVQDGLAAGLAQKGRFDYLARVIRGAQTLVGMLEGTMSQDVGYCFLGAGRHLERADMSTRLIDVRSGDLLSVEELEGLRPYENIQWMSVLKSLTGYQMYRQSMRTRVNRRDVLGFLFKDPHFPRSVACCLAQLQTELEQLPGHDGPLRELGRLRRRLDGEEVEALNAERLHAFVDELQQGLADVHGEISRSYFFPE